MEKIKRFFEPVVQCKKIFLTAIIPHSMRAIGPIGSVILIQNITKAIEKGSEELFFNYIAIFLGFIFFYQFISRLCRYKGRVLIRTDVIKSIYPSLIKKIVYSDNTSFEKLGTGRIISVIEQGLNTHISLLERFFHQGTMLFFVLCVTTYYLWSAGRQYGIGFIGVVIILNIVLLLGTQKIRDAKYKESGIKNERTRILVRIIMSKIEVMQSNKLGQEIRRLDNNIDEKKETIKSRVENTHWLFFIPFIIGSLLTLIVFSIVGYGVLQGEYSFSDLVLYAGILTLFENSIIDLTFFVKDIFEQSSKITKMRDVIDGLPQMKGFNAGKSFSYKQGNIVLEKIDFSYDGGKKIIDNLSLTIQGGKKTALVGVSGSGKSTLVKIIAGYLRSDAGKITVDNQDLHDISLQSYYSQIGYLTQEPSVFDGTIKDNLLYAVQDTIEESELKKYISLANCEFIRDLPHGIHTEIGERGVRLSGGQRQRLAIAKIFLKNPHIIILDEPTSALDSFSEDAISEAMNNLYKNRTVIIIAHRLQTVKNADDIIVMHDGEILERGTHENLVSQQGSYAKMLELQAGF